MSLNFNPSLPPVIDKNANVRFLWVPESWVLVHQEANLPPEWINQIRSLSKPGFIRWMVHPSDKYFGEQLSSILRERGYPSEFQTYPTPLLLTESRSLYPSIVFPGHPQISPRLSLTHGFGPWHGRKILNTENVIYTKRISAKDADYSFAVSQDIIRKLGGVSGRYFRIQPDRMTVSLRIPEHQSFNLGMTFRDINSYELKRNSSIKNDNIRLIPGYVSADLVAGPILALLNGYLSETEFIKNLEAPIRGRAWADFTSSTGYVHGSPHSQNVLLEADELMRLNGFMVIRDPSDLVPTRDAVESDPSTAEIYHLFRKHSSRPEDGILDEPDPISFQHSFHKGNMGLNLFSYISSSFFDNIAMEFYLNELSKITQIPIDELNKAQQKYFYEIYPLLLLNSNESLLKRIEEGIIKFRKHQNKGITENLISLSDEENLKSLLHNFQPEQIPQKTSDKALLRIALIKFLEGANIDLILNHLKKSLNAHRFSKLTNHEKAWFGTGLILLSKTPDIKFILNVIPYIQSFSTIRKALEILKTSASLEDVSNFLKILTRENKKSRNKDNKEGILKMVWEIEDSNFLEAISKRIENKEPGWSNPQFIRNVYFLAKEMNSDGSSVNILVKPFSKLSNLPDDVLLDLGKDLEEGRDYSYIRNLFTSDPRGKYWINLINTAEFESVLKRLSAKVYKENHKKFMNSTSGSDFCFQLFFTLSH